MISWLSVILTYYLNEVRKWIIALFPTVLSILGIIVGIALLYNFVVEPWALVLESCSKLNFDLNSDDQFTITDAWLMFKWLLLAPGGAAQTFLSQTSFGIFFEIHPFFIAPSGLTWFLSLVVLGPIFLWPLIMAPILDWSKPLGSTIGMMLFLGENVVKACCIIWFLVMLSIAFS